MNVTPEEVRRVAALARLRLDAAEEAAMAAQLGAILEHVRVLRGADGSDAEALAGAAGQGARLRADGSAPELLQRSPDMLAPAWEQGFFVVPRLPALDRDALPRDDAS